MEYLKNVIYKTTKSFLSFIFIPFECWSYFTLLLINPFQTREVTIIDIFLLTNGMIHMCLFFFLFVPEYICITNIFLKQKDITQIIMLLQLTGIS